MIEDLGWSKAQFAMLGSLSLINAFFFPVAGRLADVFGVKRAVMLGVIVLPLAFIGYSLMSGPVWQYVALQLATGFLCVTTTTTVYSRVAVEHVTRARGLALAIVASGPAITGALGTPIVNWLVETHGWRATYHAMAAFAALSAVITLLLLPSGGPVAGDSRLRKRRLRDDYPVIFRSSVFWLMVVAMLACNLPQIVAMSQLKMILMGKGIAPQSTSMMISAVPLGVLAGRFVSGYALDRFPSHIVGFFGMVIPSFGLALLATSLNAHALLTLAAFCLGFSVGAEGDIVAFVVARKFGVEIFSSVMGLLTMAISLSVALGAAILSLTLKLTGEFHAFIAICSVTVFVGGVLFLFIGRAPVPAPSTSHAPST